MTRADEVLLFLDLIKPNRTVTTQMVAANVWGSWRHGRANAATVLHKLCRAGKVQRFKQGRGYRWMLPVAMTLTPVNSQENTSIRDTAIMAVAVSVVPLGVVETVALVERPEEGR